MTKSCILVTSLLGAMGCPGAAHAQADFRPGYLVRLAGDTVRGEIDYRDARFNAKQCRFRATPDAAITTFRPAELQAYGLRDGSKRYRTFALPPAPAPADAAAACFLEILVGGPATLYAFRDADRADHYYVATETFALTELVQRKVLLEEQRILQTQNLYRATLARALFGCPAAQAQLPALPFTPKALGQAVAAYNACRAPASAQPPPTPAKRPRQPVRLAVVLGAERATTHFEGPSLSPSSLELGPSSAPIGGLALNMPLTALSNKLSLEVELVYESQRYNQPYGSGVGPHNNYHFEMAYAKLPVLVRYTFPRGRVRPVLEVGPTLGYALKLTTEMYFTSNAGVDSAPTAFFADNHRRLQQGLLGGAGIRFGYWQGRQATLLARYEQDTGWSEGVYFSTFSTHLYGLLTLDIF